MAAGVRRWLRWAGMLAPHGAWILAQRWQAHRRTPPVPWALLRTNEPLAGSRAGEHCFVLGNGPSVKALDLRPLKGHTVFSVSNGYLHHDYGAVKPQFHCVPQVSRAGMREADIVKWFQEMHERTGDAVLFLSDTEADLVRQHGLFPGRQVHYLRFQESFDERASDTIVDLARPVPRVESVPVMVLMVAMYLGFKHIALLGIDHDHFKSGVYRYAFDLGAVKGKDPTVHADGTVAWSRHDDFQSLARLWRQYRALRQIAECHGVRIVNASPGGELDEFARADYAELVGPPT